MTISKSQLINTLNFFFSILRNRWENGITLFEEKIDNYKNKNLKKNLKEKDIINTPIHNIITINEDFIFLLLDSIFMQRLRNIHHQGLAYLVYPTANHFRFEHSLGTYKLVNDILDSLISRRKCSNYDNCEFKDDELKISALLHDIGHYPFSHIGERIFRDFLKNPILIDIVNLNDDIFKYCNMENHELRTAKIIMGEDIIAGLRNDYGIKIKNINPFEEFIHAINLYKKGKNQKLDLKNISRLIIGHNINDKKIGHLINGPMDVDKIDYILREAYFTGTPFGNIDLYRIIEGYLYGTIIKEGKKCENQLVLNKRMIPSILQLYVGRQFNYLTISYHRTVRIAETLLKVIFDLVIQEFLIQFKEENNFNEIFKNILFHFKLMEDRDFLHFLEMMIELSPMAKNLFNKFISRTLYKNFIKEEPIPYNKFTKGRKINKNLKLYIPNVFLVLDDNNNVQNLFNNSIDIIKNFYEKLTPANKDNFEKLSEYLKNYIDEFLILNTIIYPLSDDAAEKEINKHMKEIFIYDERNPEITTTLLDDPIGVKLSSFLKEIFRRNSTVIIATEQNLADKLKKSGLFENFNFLEEFIYLFVLYDENKILLSN